MSARKVPSPGTTPPMPNDSAPFREAADGQGVSGGIQLCADGQREGKPYLTARKASALLGVPLERVIEDIDLGMTGNLAALIGAAVGGVYMVPSWELEGDRLAMHRARLAASEATVTV